MPRSALEIRPLYTRFLFSDVFERKKRRPIDGPRRQSGRMETDQRGPRVNALTSSLHQAAYINVSFKLFLFSSTFTSEIDGHTSAGQNDNCFRLKKSLREREKKGGGCALRQLKYSIKLRILLVARIDAQIRAGRWGGGRLSAFRCAFSGKYKSEWVARWASSGTRLMCHSFRTKIVRLLATTIDDIATSTVPPTREIQTDIDLSAPYRPPK